MGSLGRALNITPTPADMRRMSEVIRRQGSGKDKVLAHINPRELALLKKYGGLKGTNQKTGLPEYGLFDDIGSFVGNLFDSGGGQAAADTGATAGFDASGVPTSGYDPTAGLSAGSTLPTAAQEISSAATPNLDAALQGAGLAAQQPVSGGFFDSLTNYLSSPGNLAKVGIGAGGLGLGLYNQMAAADQSKQAQTAISGIPQNLTALSQQTQQQLNNLSQQYQTMVNQSADAIRGMAEPLMQQYLSLVNTTNAGKLTPANQQVMEAARARIAQDAASRGGVGAAQAQTQLDRLQATLLASQMQQAMQLYAQAAPAGITAAQTQLTGTNAANQYQTAGMQNALNTMGLADQYALGAIQQGLQSDAQARQSMQSFYTSLAALMSGTPLKVA